MKFSLGPSGTVSNTATALIKAGYLVRDDAKGSLKNNFTFLLSDLGCNSTSETSYEA